MQTYILTRTLFVLACVMGLVTTAQLLIIEHPSLQNLSPITTDFRGSEDGVSSLKDVDERRFPKVNKEKLALETTDHGIQESLFRAFRTDSRLGIPKVFHRMKRGTSKLKNFETDRQRRIIDTKVRNVVSGIKNGKFVEAKQKFVELDDNKLLNRIVKDTYASNITHADNLIWFVRKLPYMKQYAIAYTTLLEEMKNNLHLETPQLILLDYQVNKSMESVNYKGQTQETKNKFNLLKRALREPVQNIMRIVLTGSTQRVKAYAQQKIDLNYIDKYIQHIVNLLYANGNDNTVKILSFVRQLYSIPEYAIGYEAVFKEMNKKDYWTKDGGTLFTFGVKIKEVMEMRAYSKIDQKYKNIFEALKSKLPATVRHILWDNVYIKSKKYSEYFFAGSDKDQSSGYRQMFTWGGSGGKHSVLNQAKWKFLSVNNDNNFRIYNSHYNEYLKHCVPILRGYLPWPCMPLNKAYDSYSEWELLLVDRNKNIVIKNKSSGQFVYATTDTVNYRRNIVLKHQSVHYYDEVIWQVEK